MANKKKRETAYLIRPTEKKSISRRYIVFENLENGNTRRFDVEEHYRWGQGFLLDESELPKANAKEIYCCSDVGNLYHDLDDTIDIWFNFDENFTEDDQIYIRDNYINGDEDGHSMTGWLFEGSHGRDFDIDDEQIVILAPFTIDLVYTDNGEVLENDIKLKGRNKK